MGGPDRACRESKPEKGGFAMVREIPLENWVVHIALTFG